MVCLIFANQFILKFFEAFSLCLWAILAEIEEGYEADAGVNPE